jgi:ribose/xylose/arabinose/galactoside ABC-type transport system permease subunit
MADWTNALRRTLDRAGTLVATAGVWCLFAALSYAVNGRNIFATWENTQNVLLQTAVVGVAALGATVVIVSGGIDLSCGSLIALTSVVAAWVMEALAGSLGAKEGGMSPNAAGCLAALAAVAIAAACGLGIGAAVIGRVGRVAAVVLGIAVAAGSVRTWPHLGWWAAAIGLAVAAALWLVDRRLKIDLPLLPFIVTLGAWGALRGVAKGISDNNAIYPQACWLNRLMVLPAEKPTLGLLWRPHQWWSPGVWVLLVLAVAIAAVLRYTQFGRHAFAIGSNEQTARLCGVAVERTKLKIYVLAVLLAGVAGVLQYGKLGIGDPVTASGYELKVIASVVIGGASLSGGVGGVLGTVAGALLIMMIDNGCTKIGVANWVQEILTGGIIVAAVALDKLRHRAAD